MPLSEIPCLNLSVARLSASGSENFAVWVLKAPYPSGYVLHDCVWEQTLTQIWENWQQMFAPQQSLSTPKQQLDLTLPPFQDSDSAVGTHKHSYSSRLMQQFGISLYEWLFQGAIGSSLAQSQGIAIGRGNLLRLRLEIRAADLIGLPWEIMQPQPGKPPISLAQQLLFSRTTSDVDALPLLSINQKLNILLVLGDMAAEKSALAPLQLAQEAEAIAQALTNYQQQPQISNANSALVECHVDTLMQPTPAQLISRLESGAYNIFFYAGHGVSAPDGGLLFLRPGMMLNGTELAQVLTRCRVTLCVFNTCWGAQPAVQNQALPRSSLAEVLIHHGVPAVLGMRDAIADHEALSFIQVFTHALAARLPIDRAVAVARQQLLTLYKFNYPAWTLPVLYMHPEFDGVLVPVGDREITQLPEEAISSSGQPVLRATLRSLTAKKVWNLPSAATARVGRLAENDIVIPEPWISQRHAEIFCRNTTRNGKTVPMYYLRDDSRFGTLVLSAHGWQKVHRQEVPLESGAQLKFGSSHGQSFEFVVEG